jgi:hypothetical protein
VVLLYSHLLVTQDVDFYGVLLAYPCMIFLTDLSSDVLIIVIIVDNTTMMQVLWWKSGTVDKLYQLRATQRGHCGWYKGNTEATSSILVPK